MNGALRRYVLTKDNRIIDFKGWTTTVNGVDVPFDNVRRIVHIVGSGRTDATYDDYLHTIKKQSDNVFDLIEVGDLICGIKMFDDEYSLFQVKDITPGSVEIGKFDLVPKQTIRTIYKPNSKGDYIKVWKELIKLLEDNIITIPNKKITDYNYLESLYTDESK